MLLLAPLFALFLLPISLAASVEKDHAKLVQLAAANNGIIPLDESTFNALTNPKRTWSASIQFTAMDNRRRCAPCRYALHINSSLYFLELTIGKGSSTQLGLL